MFPVKKNLIMMHIYQSRAAATEATEKLKVFAQPQRLMVLSCLLGGERTVGEIDEITKISQPALSQQLAVLRRAGLVVPRRIAKQIYYRIADDRVASCMRNIELMFGSGQDAVAVLSTLASTSTQPTVNTPPSSGAAAFSGML